MYTVESSMNLSLEELSPVSPMHVIDPGTNVCEALTLQLFLQKLGKGNGECIIHSEGLEGDRP